LLDNALGGDGVMRADIVVTLQRDQVAATIDHCHRGGAALGMAGRHGRVEQGVGQLQRDVLLADRLRRGGHGLGTGKGQADQRKGDNAHRFLLNGLRGAGGAILCGWPRQTHCLRITYL